MTGHWRPGASALPWLVLLAVVLPGGSLHAQSKCGKLQFLAAGHAARLQTVCAAEAAAAGTATDVACLATAAEKLQRKWDRATARGDCPTTTDTAEVQAIIEAFLAALTGTLRPPTLQTCCDTGPSCFAGPSIDAAGCQYELSGILGAPGSICDGATGNCVDPPGSGGPCCDLTSLTVCAAGPDVDPSDCVLAGGLDYPSAVCDPSGACVVR